MVCGTIDSKGRPVYFTMPREASDMEVRSEAFKIRNGRELSQIETSLLKIAEGT